MRICSLVPSGTEIVYALGLGEELVGVSHECDYPPDALAKPRLLRTVFNQDRLSSEEIDNTVRASLERRQSLYQVDEEVLRRARPDLVLTQELCEVCAIDAVQVATILQALSFTPRIISLHPHALREALEDIRVVGEGTARQAQAERLLGFLHGRVNRIQTLLADVTRRPRVFCLEWMEPPMAVGHWVPEMVALAGGTEVLGRAGQASRYVSAEEIVAARPEVLILMPCGFPIERTRKELGVLTSQRWWHQVPAIREGQVYVVNGPAYFNRAGPRLVDGIELLAGILHPEACRGLIPSGAAAPVLPSEETVAPL